MAEYTSPERDTAEIVPAGETTLPDRIAAIRTIVYKTLVDVTTVKLIAEKIKSEVFVKFGLFKPKLKNVSCVLIEKFYRPFLTVDAGYFLDYCRKQMISFGVGEEVREVMVGGQSFQPELEGEETPVMKVTLPVFERIVLERRVYLVFDKFGNEIDPEDVPYAPCEENPESVLEKYRERIEKLEMPPDGELEVVKSRLIQKPVDVEKIARESFEISDRVVTYVPYYKVVFKSLETGEVKSVEIDGVTGEYNFLSD